jgi:hypothetical protein
MGEGDLEPREMLKIAVTKLPEGPQIVVLQPRQ